MLPLIELILNFLPIVRWIVGDESVIFQTLLGVDWLFIGLSFLGRTANKGPLNEYTFLALTPAMGKS